MYELDLLKQIFSLGVFVGLILMWIFIAAMILIVQQKYINKLEKFITNMKLAQRFKDWEQQQKMKVI